MSFVRLGLSLCLAALLIVALGLPVSSVDGAEPAKKLKKVVVWQSDYEKARAEANRLNRPLLVHFYADWCGPCKKMDAEVLRSPELARQLTTRLIGVKINADKHLALVEKFGIESLPTDLFLEPGGRVIARSDGYRPKSEYLSSIARVDARWTQSQKTHIASDANPVDNGGGPMLGPPSVIEDAPSVTETTPAPVQPRPQIEEPRPSPSPTNSKPSQVADAEFGLDGFSPVALFEQRQWIKGDRRFASEYKGVHYLFVDAAELEEFNIKPQRYAPRLMGCDPVLLFKTERLRPGSTQHAAFYNGELYLFTSAATRGEFKASPDKFIRARYVLRSEDLEQLGLRRAAVEPETTAR